jgi:hypothetical protein
MSPYLNGLSVPERIRPLASADVTGDGLITLPSRRTSGQRGRSASTDMVRHDRTYVEAMAPRRERWKSRARDPALTEIQRTYAANRADCLTRGLRGRVRDCATRGVEVKCACGKRMAPWRCQKSLVCWQCASHRRWQVVDRIKHAILRQQAMEPGSRTLLITLTAAHTVRRLGGRVLSRAEELEDLRTRLADGWRAFSRAVGKRWGFTPYVGVWEVTPGTSSRGHLHMHVVVQWGFRPWSEIARMWRECCPSSTRISIVQSWADPRTSASRAAEYLAKYIGKTRGRDTDRKVVGRWTPELHAQVHAATYQLRWLYASRGHLPPIEGICPCCGEHPVPCDAGRAWQATPGGYEWVPPYPDWWDPLPVQLRLLE